MKVPYTYTYACTLLFKLVEKKVFAFRKVGSGLQHFYDTKLDSVVLKSSKLLQSKCTLAFKIAKANLAEKDMPNYFYNVIAQWKESLQAQPNGSKRHILS